MLTRRCRTSLLMLTALLVAAAPVAAATPMTTALTYQGVLKQAGAPFNGVADIQCNLWDDPAFGSLIGSTTVTNVTITDGLFTIQIDFGANAFDGDARWLALAVRSPAGAGAYTNLLPRQPLTAAPYSSQTRGMFVDASENVELVDTLHVRPTLNFVGVNRNNRVSGNEFFGVFAPVGAETYGGMYVETEDAAGWPFYGYNNNTLESVWHYWNPVENHWNLHIGGGSRLTVRDNGDVGLGTVPTSGARLHLTDNGGDGVNATSSTSGRAAYVANSSGDANGMHIIHDTNNQIPALEIDGTGNSLGLNIVLQGGISRLVELVLNNGQQFAAAFYVEADTAGVVAEFISDNPTNTEPALRAHHDGNGEAIVAVADGADESIVAYQNSSGDTAAILGSNEDTDGFGIGVRGMAGWRGVYGQATGGGTGSRYGVYGIASSTASTNYGVYGTAFNAATNWAGYFAGAVNVTGTLSKGGGSFRIDHPLDPENKYLYHSFVESPDMMNLYNGNVTLDASGAAEITMPEWFEPLNRDFRYQLTSIGAPGPNLYVSSEMDGNRFAIAGGEPGAKVSWQVTGIRQDKFAEANRIPIEEDKPLQERGTYLHPEAWGKAVSLSAERAADQTRTGANAAAK